MSLIVQKYGGTSVANIERIANVARRVLSYKKRGHDLIVVVSAMSGETDRLIGLADKISPAHDEREHDVLIATGETVTTALLAMTLTEMGAKARSLQANQVRICSDGAYTRARITSVDTDTMRRYLKEGYILVVSGFQGIDERGDINTLGRGGSDTTAVALAAALKADECEIFTDVDGVYTADPRICSNARKIHKISYEEMIELASMGSKVLQIRSVEFGMKYNVPIHVRSSLSDVEGTLVTWEDTDMEQMVVTGVAHDFNQAKVTISGIPDKPGVALKIFAPVSKAGISVDMIIQNASRENIADITFTVSKTDLRKTMEIVKKVAAELGASYVDGDENIAKVSVVGVGMRSHAGAATIMFEALSKSGINILMISTSEIKISCIIEAKYTELAVRVLHDAFGLDAGPKKKTAKPTAAKGKKK